MPVDDARQPALTPTSSQHERAPRSPGLDERLPREHAPRRSRRGSQRGMPGPRRLAAGITAFAVVVAGGAAAVIAPAAAAASTVALVGSLQDELGCPGDWQPECAATELAPVGGGKFQAQFTVPAGEFEYKVALNDTWDESYGGDGGGGNSPLVVAGPSLIRFTYDDATHRTALTPLSLSDGADDATLVKQPVRDQGADQRFYFVMTDRFANGDATNDRGGLTGDRVATGFDPTDKGFYEGGDLAGLRSKLDYIEGLGTTAIWLTPSFKNRPVQGTGAAASAGYHGYWVTDFTQIDPHLGTNAELEQLVADAHARGIKVYFDIITNHTADVIDYQQKKYEYIDQATTPYRDAEGNVFDPAAYAGGDTFPTLNAASFPYTPVVAPQDADVKVPAWLNDVTKYHNRGNSTYTGESTTYGDFDGLDDLMTEDPAVVDGFVDVYNQWVDRGIDGFRIDTAKHVNFEFWQKFTTQVRAHATAKGNDDFFMFGEVYDADPVKLAPYLRDSDMNAVLDFTFQSAAVNFAKGGSANTLKALFAGDDRYTTPTTNAQALPTFLGNHDMGRVGYFLASSTDKVQRDELAHDLMYLTRGQPVVYYGDEQGFAGSGGDKDARQTLFATQVQQYANEQLVDGTTAGSQDRYGTSAPLYTHIAALAQLRDENPALATGAQIERYASGSVYAFSRVAQAEKVEHLVVANSATSAATVTIDTLTPGAQFAPLYGTTTGATAAADGALEVTVPALGAVVLKADRTVAAPTTAGALAVTAPAAGAGLAGQVAVEADVADDVWSQTSFAYRVLGDGQWTPLGTSETTTPRVYLDTKGLKAGSVLELRAVSVDAAGHRSAASSFAAVGAAIDGVVVDNPGGGDDLVVSVPGNHNTEMGCGGDWDPACEPARLAKRADGVYAGAFTLPAGDYEYKVAIGGSWDVNYGAGGVPGGANVAYSLAAETTVTFYFDPVTHWFTSTAQGPILTAPGSYQSEAGCPGDWQPDCLASWLKDPDGDGVYELTVDDLPEGSYEVKAAHNLSWTENYGEGGAPGGANIAFSAPGGKPVTFTYVLATHLLTVQVTDPPLAGTGEERAHWIDATTIAFPATLGGTAADGAAWRLHHSATGGLKVVDGAVTGGDGAPVTLAVVAGGLTQAQLARFPALRGFVALKVPTTADAKALLRGSLVVTRAVDGALTAATGVQVPGVLDALYAPAAGKRALGATWKSGVPSLALWAPTAQDVDLLVWKGVATAAAPTVVQAKQQSDGSWTVAGKKDWKNSAFRWRVTVYAPTTDKVEVNEVTDPYSVALTTNSTHSVLVDLADSAFRPQAWTKAKQPVVKPVDQTIYELHVRDFSIDDATVPAAHRGTYLAFADAQGSGAKHLKALAQAGLTTVHLLPTFDIATIEEDRAKQATPACDLKALPPDSDAQQKCTSAVADADGFNWGYDPLHYTAPEGSYATKPDGGARVAEFRTMVGALHASGLQVVLDQVFNHTAASGQDPKSILDRVVPGYYQRLNAAGNVETSTCCQNVATEHLMAQKLMVDSVVTWAKDYKVDGFRFDLMGHHSVANMKAVRTALDQLTPAKDGVDGKKVYLYGEGWNFGEVADDALFKQATQGQLDGTGIGTFSDRLRDAVRGGGPFDEDPRVQGFGSGAYTDPNGAAINGDESAQLARVQHQADLVRLGLAGNLRDYTFTTSDGQEHSGDEVDYNGSPAGYASSPEEVVTYVDAHDNETLWDSLTYKLPAGTSMDDRIRMNTLSLATTALAQTPSFWHAGAELLRSKSLDRNSYNSGDWFNSLDLSGQDNGFGRGLPPAGDNSSKWVYQQPLLADASLKPTPDEIATAQAGALDLLRLRTSLPLLRLGSAELIEDRVTFPGSGADATPGVVVMQVDDPRTGMDIDRRFERVVVVFNASDEATTQTLPGLAGHTLRLSGVQTKGSDEVVKGTSWSKAAGSVTVPARTVAVLVERPATAPAGAAQWY